MSESRWPTGAAFIADWFPAFVEHAKARHEELIDLLSDTARELVVNSFAARHMRMFGRESSPLCWSRCEWGYADIVFGEAPSRFRHTQWNARRKRRTLGELGIVEAKVIYDHLGHAKTQLATAVAQADRRNSPSRFVMAWWLSYGGRAAQDARALEHPRLEPLGGVQRIGDLDLTTIWPLEDAGHAVLDLGLFSVAESK